MKFLEIIGEAARALREETRSAAKNINWKSIIGFRNIVVHAYHDLDWDAVQDIITNLLDDLKEKVEALKNKTET